MINPGSAVTPHVKNPRIPRMSDVTARPLVLASRLAQPRRREPASEKVVMPE